MASEPVAEPTTVAPQGRTILASSVAKLYTEEITEQVKKLTITPKLVGFLANDDPAAKMYAKWTEKTARDLGFKYELIEASKDDLENCIMEANEDPEIHGIMIYFPVFNNGQDQYLQQCVLPQKDVEGLNHLYVKNMYYNIRYLDPPTNNMKSILPCTPLAMVKILEYLKVYNTLLPYGNRLYGKKITIVNRSEVVGRPLAALLANDGATVYSVDLNNIQIFTRGEGIKLHRHHAIDTLLSLKECTEHSDVVITGVPSKSYKFPVELIRNGAIVINFSSEKNFDTDKVKEKASLWVPSVGKVTIMMLLRNLLRLIENQQQ